MTGEMVDTIHQVGPELNLFPPTYVSYSLLTLSNLLGRLLFFSNSEANRFLKASVIHFPHSPLNNKFKLNNTENMF